MITFFIETDKEGTLLHDFSFHLVKSVEFHKWKYGEDAYHTVFSYGQEMPHPEWVPIGSLPFVFNTLKRVEKVKPLNIPDLLNTEEFLKRQVGKNLDKQSLDSMNFPLFVKESNTYKGFVDILEGNSYVKELPDISFDVSEVVDILSEWRVFVHQDRVVGVKNYGGEDVFPSPPDKNLVQAMIRRIENSRFSGEKFPLSYTLDVGVNESGTFLIEVHPFVSCGLYGFADYQCLPSMFIQGYRYLQYQSSLS